MVVGGGGEADDQVLFGAEEAVLVLGIEGGLEFVEDIDHFFVLVAAVGTVDFVDQKDDAELGKFLQGVVVEHFPHGAKFLQVDDDEAGVGFEGGLEGGFVVGFDVHPVVDVHIQQFGVDLAAKLEAIDHNHDFVVDVMTVAAQVFELEGSPADDVVFTKASGVLQQQGVDVFVVGVGFTLFDQFGAFAGGGVGELLFELVDEVVVFGFVGKEFIDFGEDFVGAKFLFGAG